MGHPLAGGIGFVRVHHLPYAHASWLVAGGGDPSPEARDGSSSGPHHPEVRSTASLCAVGGSCITAGGRQQDGDRSSGDAIANLLIPIVGKVVVSNPSKTRAMAEAKVKTDKVDARILAQLPAAYFLQPVWLPDQRTRALRHQVTRRAHLVRQRTRIKCQVAGNFGR